MISYFNIFFYIFKPSIFPPPTGDLSKRDAMQRYIDEFVAIVNRTTQSGDVEAMIKSLAILYEAVNNEDIDLLLGPTMDRLFASAGSKKLVELKDRVLKSRLSEPEGVKSQLETQGGRSRTEGMRHESPQAGYYADAPSQKEELFGHQNGPSHYNALLGTQSESLGDNSLNGVNAHLSNTHLNNTHKDLHSSNISDKHDFTSSNALSNHVTQSQNGSKGDSSISLPNGHLGDTRRAQDLSTANQMGVGVAVINGEVKTGAFDAIGGVTTWSQCVQNAGE